MESNLYQSLGQVSSADAGQIFRDHLRGCVRQMISEVMAAEVNELCGPKHKPSGNDHFRAGSSSGRVLFEGERETVVRPRVRKRIAEGSSEEVVLATYEAARDPSQLQDSIVTALMHGVSTRDVQKIKPNSPGVGKSNVSRHWQSVGHKFVDELRGRDLSKENWAVVMLDGIPLSKDQLAVAATGITTEGRKHVLDFELGSSESAEVAKDLMRQLMKRGFHCDRPLLAVLDGSDALRLAVKEFFPDAIVQRCLVHKERNIRSKLSKKHWGELARLFKRLRGVQGKDAALDSSQSAEHQCDREFFPKHAQQAWSCDTIPSRDRSGDALDVVRVIGGRERLPQDLRLRRHASFDCRSVGSQSGLGQTQDFAGPRFFQSRALL